MTVCMRKPSWLRVLCPEGNYGRLKPRQCGTCGRWLVCLQDGVWESYDPGIIRKGCDLNTAIILGRSLARIVWSPVLRQAYLVTVWGFYGLTPDGLYLAEHDCDTAPISVQPFKPAAPMRKRELNELPRMSDSEAHDFEIAWNKPLEES